MIMYVKIVLGKTIFDINFSKIYYVIHHTLLLYLILVLIEQWYDENATTLSSYIVVRSIYRLLLFIRYQLLFDTEY